jgi:acyl-CoA synthetase (AMP-forming)/AMP-acid ligase II
MLIGNSLRESRRHAPDKVALWFGDRSWTYAALDDDTDRLAARLTAAGVRAGDRVALFLPNSPELVLAYYACFKLGAVSVPLNYRYRQPEVCYALERSGATTLIAHSDLAVELKSLPFGPLGVAHLYLTGGPAAGPFAPFAGLLAGPAGSPPEGDFGPGQPAAILFTSGTTARPKGVMYTHETLCHNCAIQAETFAFTADDVHLVSTAACHAAAFTGQLLPGLATGATCVLTHLPAPADVVQAVETRRVNRVQMLPASLEDLVEHLEQRPPADLASWRCCTAGGDVVPLALHERFRKVTGFDVTELYGMTEVLSCITNLPFGLKRLGSIGRPAARTEVRLVDDDDRAVPEGQVGELLVRSAAMMVGYWDDPGATAVALRDGWMHTGDLARRDADGFYWFVGRAKEIIIRGGSNISPLEVEEALAEHPAVHLSCAVGLPDAHYGEVVAAYVMLREDAAPRPAPEGLRRFVAERLAAYKVPERVTIVGELPLNPTGKVDRVKVRARAIVEGAAPR